MSNNHFDEEPTPIERFSSGDPFLDYAIGGGYPKGRIVEIFGHSSSGKSTLALIAIAQVQREGGLCAYVDVENSFDGVYAQRMGVNLKQLMLVAHPGCGEQALQIVDQLARSGFDLIVVDSVSALVPKAEQEGQIMDDTIGSLARVMGKGVKYLTSDVKNANSVVIFINQLRNRIGGYGGPEVTSGGEALKYHASIRVQVKANKADQIKNGDKIIGQVIQTRVEKNKTCIHGRKAQLYLYHGVGLDTIASLVDACESVGIIAVKGIQFYFNGSKLGIGKDKAVEMVRQSPEIELQLRQALKDMSLKAGIILENGSEEELGDDDDMEETKIEEEIPSEKSLEVTTTSEL
eukprot:TRINITY_DN61165_c0_g1_i9.p1 TRINITY_DN61165_c0_g1~~TRINITY_DN61165_c0_g1_i9.p1  ORF type:complete len:361 (-),score=71.55 TRINITY_DN61165_c0_g1_i9:411-1454(-)